MYICVIDGSNRDLWSGYGVFAPLETRSGHGAENEQPVPRRGEKKKQRNNPPRLQNSAPI